MQTRSCDEISVCPSVCPSVRPSVCPSVKRVYCDKTEEKSVQIFIPCERTFCLVFWEEECLVGATPSTWNLTGPRWSEIVDFEPIIARSALAVRSSEKSSINTNRKSRTRFPTSLRWSAYVAPKSPKGGLKTQKGRFSRIIELRLKKVCYKVSLCEKCQRQSCRAFIGLTIHAKIVGGERPLLPIILGQCDRIGAKLPMFDQAPQR